MSGVVLRGVILRSIVGTPRRDEDGSDAVSTGCSLLCGRAGRGSRLITLLVLIYVCVNLHCYDGVDQSKFTTRVRCVCVHRL